MNGFLVTDTAPLYAYPNSVPFGIHNIAATPYAYSGPSSLTVTPGVAGLAQVGLADAGCTPTDNLVSLLFSWDYPAREVQELKDMGVTTTTHIKVLSAPAMNADTVTTYNWRTRIKVYLRTAFTQTGYNPQVWYQVSLEGETVARGWIVVRYENKSYLYSDDVCNGDVQTISLSATLTFPYNRQAATNYAIEHSYQNDINNPQANGRTTRRLGSNNLSGTLIPFANFNYSYLSNSPGSTGSAMFVSEAIWAGGLPMTVGNTNSCSDFQLFNESGWRYCLVNVGSSNSWDYHQALIAHFTDSQAPSTTITNSILLETGYTNKGTRLNFPSSNTLHDDRIWGGRGLDSSNLSSDLVPFIPNPFTGVVTDVAGLATFASLNFGSLQAGDYVYINPFDNDNHGMLIAGWGPIEDCSLAVGTRYTITNFQSAYTTSVANIVPYIVDFTRAQSPTPRPFYCSLYLESGAFINFARHDWYFYTLGNVLTLRRDKIYTDPTWQWTSTDGN